MKINKNHILKYYKSCIITCGVIEKRIVFFVRSAFNTNNINYYIYSTCNNTGSWIELQTSNICNQEKILWKFVDSGIHAIIIIIGVIMQMLFEAQLQIISWRFRKTGWNTEILLSAVSLTPPQFLWVHALMMTLQCFFFLAYLYLVCDFDSRVCHSAANNHQTKHDLSRVYHHVGAFLPISQMIVYYPYIIIKYWIIVRRIDRPIIWCNNTNIIYISYEKIFYFMIFFTTTCSIVIWTTKNSVPFELVIGAWLMNSQRNHYFHNI